MRVGGLDVPLLVRPSVGCAAKEGGVGGELLLCVYEVDGR